MAQGITVRGEDCPSCPAYWDEACEYLAGADPVMAGLIRRYEKSYPESGRKPFETLVRSIVGQQISLKAADNIWERLIKLCPILSPETVAGCDRSSLRSVGLSERKVDYILDVCRFFAEGGLSDEDLEDLSDEALIERLTSIKGVGLWTAQMFLIFTLRRPNVLPTADAGLIRAIVTQYLEAESFEALSARQKRKVLEATGERWAPWKTVATWYLWRSLDTEIVLY